VTTALARPNFFDLAPYRIADDEEAEIGNPALDPSRSLNLDVFVEHYLASIGVLSAGAFYKQIQDPIITTTFVPTSGINQGLNVFQSANGEDGYIWGIELAAQQQLRFLPGVLSGLGVYANYTYTQSEITLVDESTGVFPGQADHVFNAALSYERSGFSGQVSLNYTGDFLDEFAGDGASANRANDVFVDERWGLDFSGSYQFGASGLSAYVELLNLLNEPLVLYQGDEARPRQVEFYEPWGWVGVKYNL
jgi:TonB-dependent receptor